MLQLNCFTYIKTPINNDYELMCKAWLLENNKAATYQHVLKVATTAKLLARQFNIDENKAYIAGLLHDISAILEPEDMLVIARENHFKLDSAEIHYPFLLHQKISAMITKDYFNIKDDDILDAIAHHTTLKAMPSALVMIVFLADKIAWDQTGQPPYLEQLLCHLNQSLDIACRFYLNYLFDENKLLYPHLDIITAHDYFNK